MTIKDLIVAIQEKNLTLEQIEQYRDDMANISARMEIEWADLEKKQALFFADNSSEKVSGISIKRKWSVTPEGQRQIELKGYIKATNTLLSSLKARIYSLIK